MTPFIWKKHILLKPSLTLMIFIALGVSPKDLQKVFEMKR
jgi:hypothetical protein